jgi:hypothetical protein
MWNMPISSSATAIPAAVYVSSETVNPTVCARVLDISDKQTFVRAAPSFFYWRAIMIGEATARCTTAYIRLQRMDKHK